MKRTEIVAKTEELVTPIIEENHFELVDVEYVREGANWYLRVYADKEGGINIDDCVLISRALEEKLDAECKLYKAINKQKEFEGILKDFTEDTVTIETEGNELVLDRKDIAMIRLAIDF